MTAGAAISTLPPSSAGYCRCRANQRRDDTMKFLISIAAALVLSGAVAGAATTRLLTLRAGDKAVIPKPRLACLVTKNNIACGSIDHPHSYNAVTDRRGVTITL